MAQSESVTAIPPRGTVSKEIIRKYHSVPIGFYGIKDRIARTLENDNIIDAFLIMAAFLSFSLAFSFYPLLIAIVIAIVLFYFTLKYPLIGIFLLLGAIFPIFMYQAPAVAWVFMLVMTLTLVFGYMHYRTLSFIYIMIGLAFSPLGYVLEIPALILSALVVGYKRSIVAMVIAFLIIVSFSALFGVNNFGYILYNGVTAHKMLGANPILNYTTPASPQMSIGTFVSSGFSKAYTQFTSHAVIGAFSITLSLIASSLTMQPAYAVEMIILAVLIIIIDTVAVNSRSKYKGAKASLLGIGYPIAFMGLAAVFKFNYSPILLVFSFVLGVASVYLLELYNVDVVKALNVRKQDLRMKFGEAFEELAGGMTNETFDNVANYESTKKELTESVLAPIEQKAISQAYKVRPTKGILFFGPPGTGKTMIMRALANEIRGGFYYVKASNLISMYPGETEKRISQIFAIAKKHAPCILFFDEIDFIAKSREDNTQDSTHAGAMSQLLAEMDGFNKINNVIIVGATNTPQVIDRAIMRPGRFDKIIYMPLPDYEGRKKILKLYLAKLPVSKSMDYDKLAEVTERYSGADLKNIVDTVAQSVAQEAALKHKILEITQQDLVDMVKATKPSTNLAQIEDYNKFKIEFERSLAAGGRAVEKDTSAGVSRVVGMDDAKKAIKDAIQTPLLRPDLIKKYEIKNINGILMFGPPGNGKTMLMRAIANDLTGVTLLEINGSTLASYGIERAAAKIKEVFNTARENTPSIIFIDEIEGLMPKRSGASEEAIRITVEMLAELDGLKKLSGVVVIAATNIPEMLDPAILRPGRFDKLIFVTPPKESERAEILKEYLGKVPLDKNLDLPRIAKQTEGFTGADLANVCREVKTRALEASMKAGKEIMITTEDLEQVVKITKPSAPQRVLDQYTEFLDQYGQR